VANNFVEASNQSIWWYKARIFCFNKSFRRSGTISTRISNL